MASSDRSPGSVYAAAVARTAASISKRASLAKTAAMWGPRRLNRLGEWSIPSLDALSADFLV
jgi:hypothetical protein